ncbi:hypothetical protein [Streptomyces collinus]|uniref:hypothetical protein n=1 Tax=Streptomyces collinus TaxID=42684 RepID=UPI00368BE262
MHLKYFAEMVAMEYGEMDDVEYKVNDMPIPSAEIATVWRDEPFVCFGAADDALREIGGLTKWGMRIKNGDGMGGKFFCKGDKLHTYAEFGTQDGSLTSSSTTTGTTRTS